MSLATKLNLMSLKKAKFFDGNNSISGESIENKKQDQTRLRHLGMRNSDEEDSPESSGDEISVNDDEKTEKYCYFIFI